MAEHSTADREVTGSNPVGSLFFYFIIISLCFFQWNNLFIKENSTKKHKTLINII